MNGCVHKENTYLVDDPGGGGIGLLLQGVHQHHLLLPCQGGQDGHTVEEQLHLACLILVHLPHMVPAYHTPSAYLSEQEGHALKTRWKQVGAPCGHLCKQEGHAVK